MAANGTPAAIPWPQGLASQEMKNRVASAKVLAVGAGGIGCELLKTLVMSGFRNIEVIDLDTIDVSNLNRQFLFRKHHVGQSKSAVAAAAVKRFRGDVNITAHHGNVKEPTFDIDYFRRFDVILNGLDNLEARRHVNRMCLAAGVPLVESGTAGYLGQVTVHVPGKTECFDCQPKPTQKTFPVCTIRTFPEKPIHCIIWAKELLFPALFGEDGDGADINTDGGLARNDGESGKEYATRVFTEVFTTKINAVLADAAANEEGGDVWHGRSPPEPLDLSAMGGGGEVNGASGSACAALGLTDANAVWTPEQSAAVFLESTRQLLEHRTQAGAALVFDKDDDLAVEFVAAAANLRSRCYHIPPQSLFDAKGMAGNIIHAIATTNAIISGLIVIEALKLLAAGGDPAACKATYLRQDLSNKRLLMPAKLESPAAGCRVCGAARLHVRIDTAATKFEDFLAKIVRGHLGLQEYSITLGTMTIYEESEDLEDDEVAMYAQKLGMPLAELPAGGIGHGTSVFVRDEALNWEIELLVSHKADWDEEASPGRYIIEGTLPPPPTPAAPAPAPAEDASAATALEPIALEEEDGTFVLLESENEGPAKGGDRKRKAEDGEELGGKRAKGDEGDEDAIELLD